MFYYSTGQALPHQGGGEVIFKQIGNGKQKPINRKWEMGGG